MSTMLRMRDLASATHVISRVAMVMPQSPVRDFGLTWQDPCSREAHIQLHRFVLREEPPPGFYDSDPPSVTQPPPGWVPPPIPPPPPQQPPPPTGG